MISGKENWLDIYNTNTSIPVDVRQLLINIIMWEEDYLEINLLKSLFFNRS